MLETKAWSKSVTQNPQEFPLTPLSVITGKIPPGLQGSLYRNGPARLSVGNQRVGHWFDGDGAILAVHFRGESTKATYRYVETQGYKAEMEAGKYLFPNYGMKVPGAFWNSWGKPVKNSANTSVLALPDKLLALWEGGNPYGLDLETLETFGTDNLSELTPQDTYSAHYKQDYHTKDIFNFGFSAGATNKLNLYRSDSTGKIQQRGSTEVKSFTLVHDFVMAGKYLVFCLPPVRLNILPVALGLSSFGESMTWQPQEGTQILVFDRDSFDLVCEIDTDSWYQWHFANGCVLEDGSILLAMAAYEDFQTNQYLREVPTGKTETLAECALWELRLNPQTGKVISREKVLGHHCEFPSVMPQKVGQSWRYTYLSVSKPGVDIAQELFGEIARFDHKNKSLIVSNLGENCYGSEPIYAPDSLNSDEGWLLSVVYDGNTDSSEIWIYQSDRLEEPYCRLALPSVIPPSFHGTWKSI